MARFVIDCVLFQLKAGAAAPEWTDLLDGLARDGRHEILLLDRGDTPSIERAISIPFPSYRPGQHTAADSALIQQVCDWWSADVFASTDFTTPLVTPMVMISHDRLDEFSAVEPERLQMEQALAVAYSLTYVCASREARLSLSSLYPEVPGDRIVVASADRTMATLVSDEVDLLVVDARSGRYDKFFAEWRRLRDVQATVDFS